MAKDAIMTVPEMMRVAGREMNRVQSKRARREAQEAAEAAEREQQRIQKAAEAFKPGPVEGTKVCPRCSAVVVDAEQHVRFHDGLNKTSQQASHADFMTTPIG